MRSAASGRSLRASHPLYGLSEVFRVEGERAVDNADLSDLRVDGTSVAGFAAATTSYTADVVSSVEQVTIAASTSDPDAGLAYSPADADPDADGHQVNLVVRRQHRYGHRHRPGHDHHQVLHPHHQPGGAVVRPVRRGHLQRG